MTPTQPPHTNIAAPPTILVIGEPLVELSTPEPLATAGQFAKAYGGDALITACALGKLSKATDAESTTPGLVVTVELLTGLASDAFTEGLRTLCRQHRVGLTHAVSKPNSNMGAYAVSAPTSGMSPPIGTTESPKQPKTPIPQLQRVIYYRKQSAASQLSMGDLPNLQRLLNNVCLVVASGIGLAISPSMRTVIQQVFQAARRQNIPTLLDVNYRAPLWAGGVEEAREVLRQTLPHTSITLPSLPDDTQTLLGLEDPEQCMTYFHAHGVPLVVLKAGKAGAYLSLERGVKRQFTHVPTATVSRIKNTIGAGDSFNAGFIAGLLQKQPLTTCAQWGNTLAGYKIQQADTIKGLPSAEQFFRQTSGVY